MIVRRNPRSDRRTSRTGAAPTGVASVAACLNRRRGTAFTLLCVAAGLTTVGPFAQPAGAATKERATYGTQALPGGTAVAGAAKAGATAGRSRITLKAASRFSLAGLRWSDADVVSGRMRAQRVNGSWTTWSTFDSAEQGDDGVVEGTDPQAASAARANSKVLGKEGSTEPLWTGPSRTLQVELDGPRPKGLRAAFVDVRGKIPVVARAAKADDSLANINPRSAWDPGNECKPRAPSQYGSVQAVVVHHTAGTNDYTQAQVPAVLLGICKFHRNGNGWNDIGYNYLVDRYGGAWEGRAGGITRSVIGAHAQGFNSVTAGISMLGDFMSILPPPEQLKTVARIAAWRLAVAGVPRTGTVTLTSAGGSQSRYKVGANILLPRVMAHRDVGQTDCPGNAGYTTLGYLRDTVAGLNPTIPVNLPSTLPAAPQPVKITISTKRRINAGLSSVISGTATQGTAALKSATVALQVNTSGSTWSTITSARTTSSGKYRFTHKFSRTWKMRVARTDGDGGTSSAVSVVLVPVLKLTVPKRLKINKRIVLTGSIAPGRGPVTLIIARRSSSGKYVEAAPVKVKQTGRTLRVAVVPHSAALYRFQLRYAGSELAAAARSPLAFGRAVSDNAGGGGAAVSE